jgi:hypothetical protein
MYQTPIHADAPQGRLDLPGLLDLLASVSARPRHAFMVLNLIAKAAGPDGKAGPIVWRDGEGVTLRDWLCDAILPLGRREPGRQAMSDRVREGLRQSQSLPSDPAQAEQLVEGEVLSRLRASCKTNISRAVSELVRAGLLVRHYQGYWVDHHNRGARRQAVYTLTPTAWQLLGGNPDKDSAKQPDRSMHTSKAPRQATLPFA